MLQICNFAYGLLNAKIKNEDLLLELALDQNVDDLSRCLAIGKIRNKEYLAQLVKKIENEDLRLFSICVLADAKLLQRYAREGSNNDMRKSASIMHDMLQLNDFELYNLYQESIKGMTKDEDRCLAALMHMKDLDLLTDIVLNGKMDEDIFALIKIDSQEHLTRIVQRCEGEKLGYALYALMNITNQTVLSEIAKSHPIKSISLLAATRLNDKQLAQSLYEKILLEEDDSVRQGAISLLTNRAILQEIKENSFNDGDRKEAENRLKEL